MNSIIALIFVFSFNSSADVVTLPAASVPKENIDFWNDEPTTQWNNNCYNYSTNRVTNSFAQPGEASNAMYDDLTCESVELAASKDLGLTLVKHFDYKDKNDETLIALVVAPGYDFHWYRRDDNNFWTHKPGATAATKKDQNGDVIPNPETADRGPYTDFCGYFKIKNHIKDKSEQDAGYVRVGNMLNLPDVVNNSPVGQPQQNSEIEILIYSGRKNPRLPLQALLQKSAIAETLQELGQRIEQAPAGVLNIPHVSRLGYNGILIRDHQGLLFPKGTSVHVVGDSVIAYSKGRTAIVIDPRFLKLEQQLKAHFSVPKN